MDRADVSGYQEEIVVRNIECEWDIGMDYEVVKLDALNWLMSVKVNESRE